MKFRGQGRRWASVSPHGVLDSSLDGLAVEWRRRMGTECISYHSRCCDQMPEKKQSQGGRVRLSPHLEDVVHLCGESPVMGAAISCASRSLRLLAHTGVGQQVGLGTNLKVWLLTRDLPFPPFLRSYHLPKIPIFKIGPNVQTCDPGGENLPLSCSCDEC